MTSTKPSPPTRIVLLLDASISRLPQTTTINNNNLINTILLSSLRTIQSISSTNIPSITCRIFDSLFGGHKLVAKKLMNNKISSCETPWKEFNLESWKEIKTCYKLVCDTIQKNFTTTTTNTSQNQIVIEALQIGADGAFRDVWNKSIPDAKEVIIIVTNGPGSTKHSTKSFFGIEQEFVGDDENQTSAEDLNHHFQQLYQSVTSSSSRKVIWIDVNNLISYLTHHSSNSTSHRQSDDELLDVHITAQFMNANHRHTNNELIYVPIERAMMVSSSGLNILPIPSEIEKSIGKFILGSSISLIQEEDNYSYKPLSTLQFGLSTSHNNNHTSESIFILHNIPGQKVSSCPGLEYLQQRSIINEGGDVIIVIYPRNMDSLQFLHDLHDQGEALRVCLISNNQNSTSTGSSVTVTIKSYLLIPHCQGLGALYLIPPSAPSNEVRNDENPTVVGCCEYCSGFPSSFVQDLTGNKIGLVSASVASQNNNNFSTTELCIKRWTRQVNTSIPGFDKSLLIKGSSSSNNNTGVRGTTTITTISNSKRIGRSNLNRKLKTDTNVQQPALNDNTDTVTESAAVVVVDDTSTVTTTTTNSTSMEIIQPPQPTTIDTVETISNEEISSLTSSFTTRLIHTWTLSFGNSLSPTSTTPLTNSSSSSGNIIIDSIQQFLIQNNTKIQRKDFIELLIKSLESIKTVASQEILLVCYLYSKTLTMEENNPNPTTTTTTDKKSKKIMEKIKKEVKKMLTDLSILNINEPIRTRFNTFLRDIFLPLCKPWDLLKVYIEEEYLELSSVSSPVPMVFVPGGKLSSNNVLKELETTNTKMNPPPLPILKSHNNNTGLLLKRGFSMIENSNTGTNNNVVENNLFVSPTLNRRHSILGGGSQPMNNSSSTTNTSGNMVKRSKTISSMLPAVTDTKNKLLLNHFSRVLSNPEMGLQLRVTSSKRNNNNNNNNSSTSGNINMKQSSQHQTNNLSSVVPTSTIRNHYDHNTSKDGMYGGFSNISSGVHNNNKIGLINKSTIVGGGGGISAVEETPDNLGNNNINTIARVIVPLRKSITTQEVSKKLF
jgi:hypothetical protein